MCQRGSARGWVKHPLAEKDVNDECLRYESPGVDDACAGGKARGVGSVISSPSELETLVWDAPAGDRTRSFFSE